MAKASKGVFLYLALSYPSRSHSYYRLATAHNKDEEEWGRVSCYLPKEQGREEEEMAIIAKNILATLRIS